MIDLKKLRDNPELLRLSQKARGQDPELVDQVLSLDEAHRRATALYEQLRSEQNAISHKIPTVTPQDKHTLLERGKELAPEVKKADANRAHLLTELQSTLAKIHNIVSSQAPIGGAADFTILEHVRTPRDFLAEGFTPKDHVELGKLLKAIDIERAAKVSGSRFYYLTGPGALLEFALINFAISLAVKAGLTPVIPPVLVKPPAMEGTGFLGQAAENVFHLEEDDYYLVGTSEVSLAAYHADEVLEELPLRYAGYSSCFRREAGTYGKDTRGIIRVHQFEKVEMFIFAKPEDAEREHQKLLAWEKEFIDALEIPYRVIDVATGDLGASAIRKFDIEAWIPTQGVYREVTSTSNCTDFQSRRLNIRYRDDSSLKPVHTLNGTLVAIPRMIVAILENHQNSDGSVTVPPALRPFLGMDVITPA